MRAKAKDYPAGPVVAFGGHEFVKYEWREVPVGCEAEAELHPFLEVEVLVEAEPEHAPEEAAEPEAEPAPMPKAKRKTTTRQKRTPKAKDADK